MKRVVLAVAFMAASAQSFAADDAESLDEDFLAYLAELESEQDDWTIVDAPATPPKKSAEPAKRAAPVAPTSKSQTPPPPANGSKP